MHGWGGMYVLVWGLEDTLEEVGVDVEDFKMDVRKQMGYIWFTCLRICSKYWSVNINIRLIFGVDVLTAEFFTILFSIVGRMFSIPLLSACWKMKAVGIYSPVNVELKLVVLHAERTEWASSICVGFGLHPSWNTYLASLFWIGRVWG